MLDRVSPVTSGIGAEANAVRGWVDDFKVIALNIINTEERCHHARGTLIKVNSLAHNFWKAKSASYPDWVHKNIARQAGLPENSRFVCFTEYGNYQGQMSSLTSNEWASDLHKIPYGTESVRERIITENKPLVYGQPRPDQSNNKFCLSCHVEPSYSSHRELNIAALLPSR